jgi:ribonuclease-3
MKPEALQALQSALRCSFTNTVLLQQALTHPSRGHEIKQNIPDNQRLEFLGDAVLQLVLTRELYDGYPKLPEGDMTKLRAGVVNRGQLASVARQLNLGDHLILGRGEERNQGRSRESNLADAVEAIIGALYLDSGYDAARDWILPLLRPALVALAASNVEANPKGRLQEWLQHRAKPTPVYILLSETGPDHEKNYEVAVEVDGERLGTGNGSSKKAAEISAAQSALERLEKAV